jgi:hypothetical protein
MMDIHQVCDNRIVVTGHLEDFAGLMTQFTAQPNRLFRQHPVR